jgi:prepilin-type N-terminal cleavage/methylation domain-containing protein
MHSKNHNPSIHFTSLTLCKTLRTSGEKQKINAVASGGFTLVEVMLAMTIAGLTFAPIFLMYTMIIKRVSKSSRTYDYIILCKNFLNEARQKQELDAQTFSLEKKEIEFDASLTYSLEKGVGQQSTLKSLQGLHPEMVTISWQENGQKKQEQLVAFVYKKPEQKK